MTATVPAELAARAREAWAYMTQPVDPMPAHAAVDYVMNDTTDDRHAAKLALYGAAADAVNGGRPPAEAWFTTPDGVEKRMRLGVFINPDGCWGLRDDPLRDMRNWLADTRTVAHAEWGLWQSWHMRAATALALCREIEAAP